MRGLAHYCFFSAAVYAAIGMAGGIYMAATHDHTLATAHAHLNLIGWVSLALFGLYYNSVPQAAATRLATLHVATATLGLWTLIPGIAMVYMGMSEGLAIFGSLVTIVAMLLFAIVVGRSYQTRRLPESHVASV